MNGELYQICSIAVAAKSALRNDTSISYTISPYEKKIEFSMLTYHLPESMAFRAGSVEEWYSRSLQYGLNDMKLLAPVVADNRSFLGFSNAVPSQLICYYDGNPPTSYRARWSFDAKQNGWNILYVESEWPDPPSGKPVFADNTDSFRTVLIDIEDLASTIGANSFSGSFRKALELLDGTQPFSAEPVSGTSKTTQDSPISGGSSTAQLPTPLLSLLPPLLATHSRLFAAADQADVFGAMGSWNDEPPYLAMEKGLAQEYATLSDELLKQIRLAVLFAVNEW